MHSTEITREALPDLQKGQGHKYDHGHALVVAGPPGQGGAARLAARGALRIGAGLVTLVCPLRALSEHASQLNAVMTRGIDGPSGLSELLEDVRVSSICLGPGLGLTQITADMVRFALAARRPVVLDADALSRFERAPAVLFDQLHDAAVLTPHDGEFRRLFPDLAEEQHDRLDATAKAAARAGSVILRKGSETIVADPSGGCAVHKAQGARAAPWLATAGAGDVLAGFIAGLMARGFSPSDAAQASVWLHVECALSFGPGLIAEDLPEELPKVFAAIAA